MGKGILPELHGKQRSMNVAIICFDTRGGIQPYAGIAERLLSKGHQVNFFAPSSFKGLVADERLNFIPLPGDPKDLMEDPRNKGVAEKGFSAVHSVVMQTMRILIPQWTRIVLEASVGCDVILGSVAATMIAPIVGEKLSIPFIQAHVQPWTPTVDFPGMLAPSCFSMAPAWLCRFTHQATRHLFWSSLRGTVSDVRRSMGLSDAPSDSWLGRSLRGQPLLYGFSETIIPRPTDWPEEVRVCGYWFKERQKEWSPSPSLVSFLDDGPKPVCIGFGSMGSSDAAVTTSLVVEAVRMAGVRAVLLSGWGGFEHINVPSHVHVTESVPHDWIMPSCSVSVHHGGAGTTGATLRAGIPSVIVPFTADQPFWARQTAKRGLGIAAPARRHLSAKILAGCITKALQNDKIKERAEQAGSVIRSEDGVGNVIQHIEEFLQRG